MINKKVVKYIPEGKEFGFDDLMLRMINKNEPVKIHSYNGYWLDIVLMIIYRQLKSLQI